MQSSSKIKLKEIAHLSLGHTFRSATQTAEKQEGGFLLAQVKGINLDAELLFEQLEKIKHKFNKSIDLLRQGDLVLCPRDHKLVTALVDKEIPNLIISAPLILIRVNCELRVDPEYLQLILNSKLMQKNLKQLLVGTSVRTLQKNDLEEIEIPLPGIEEQKLFAQIYKHSKLERKLRNKLYKLRGLERETVINKSLESLLAA
jgi:type I restriction enzyme M protein